MKVRKKPCRHCLFTKHACVIEPAIQRAIALQSPKPFECHEHSDKVVCCGYYARLPDNVDNPEKISYNGDLKSKFAQMTKVELNSWSVGGGKF